MMAAITLTYNRSHPLQAHALVPAVPRADDLTAGIRSWIRLDRAGSPPPSGCREGRSTHP